MRVKLEKAARQKPKKKGVIKYGGGRNFLNMGKRMFKDFSTYLTYFFFDHEKKKKLIIMR